MKKIISILSKNEKLTISIPVIIFIFIIVLTSVLVHQTRRYNNIKNRVINLEKDQKEYNNLPNILATINNRKEEVQGVIAKYSDFVINNIEDEQVLLDQISKICKNSNISLNRFNPIETISEVQDNKKRWAISFQTRFNKILKVLSLIEEYFHLEVLTITSARTNTLHTVDITITPFIYNKKDQSKEFIGILRLSENIEQILSDIQKKEQNFSLRDSLEKDPMLFRDTIFPVKKIDSTIVYRPKLSLEGILWDTETPLAVINGKVYKIGDIVEGARVEKISKTSVTMIWNGKPFILNVVKNEEDFE